VALGTSGLDVSRVVEGGLSGGGRARRRVSELEVLIEQGIPITSEEEGNSLFDRGDELRAAANRIENRRQQQKKSPQYLLQGRL